MQDRVFRPRFQPTALGVLGLLGFAASLAVHVLSYAGIAAAEHVPAVWALHVGIFPLFFALVLRMRHWSGTSRQWDWWKQPPMRELLRYFPAWVKTLVPVLFFYVFVNFFLATAGAMAVEAGGRQTLAPVDSARAFSGHWLIFYLLPALFFSFVPADARPSDAAAVERAAG